MGCSAISESGTVYRPTRTYKVPSHSSKTVLSIVKIGLSHETRTGHQGRDTEGDDDGSSSRTLAPRKNGVVRIIRAGFKSMAQEYQWDPHCLLKGHVIELVRSAPVPTCCSRRHVGKQGNEKCVVGAGLPVARQRPGGTAWRWLSLRTRRAGRLLARPVRQAAQGIRKPGG